MSGVNDNVQVDLFGDGGVLKQVLKVGSGRNIPRGAYAAVLYWGRFVDGTLFDSRVNRHDPFRFVTGNGNVIRAWDVGIVTMKQGERSIFTCRSDYAYGPLGSPPDIPPEATLCFEIELLFWEPEDISPKRNKGILRHTLVDGVGYDLPKSGAEVDVTLVGEYEGREFFNERVQFCLGEGSSKKIPKGVEKAIKKMVKGEKSKMELKSEYGFGSEGHEIFKIPPNATIFYTITLHSYAIVKETWLMNSAEKLEYGRALKDKGTNYYKEENYTLALKMWRKQSALLEKSNGFETTEEDERKRLLLSAFLNASMALLKSEDFSTARECCTKAIEIDDKNVKAYFRRGQAYLHLNEPQLAKADFQKVIELEPTNKAAMTQLAISQKRVREIKNKEKQIYTNMFKRMAKDEVSS